MACTRCPCVGARVRGESDSHSIGHGRGCDTNAIRYPYLHCQSDFVLPAVVVNLASLVSERISMQFPVDNVLHYP